jgi:pimeloyl-ACP methyl ester carboxylesterase
MSRTSRALAPQVADPYIAPPDLAHGIVRLDNSVRLHYVVAGEGDPVVLVPGYPQSWYAWRFVISLLTAKGRKVYAIDPRGFGDSDMPADGYDMDTAADDLHSLIISLGLAGETGVDIISHDVGTWIAHAHAAKYPTDVRRLVLTDAHIPGVSPLPDDVYPNDQAVQRRWHFYFNRVQGLPEALIQGHEREFLTWFFGPEKMTRTWTIDHNAFEEYLRVFTRPGAVRAGLMYYREIFSEAGREASDRRTKQMLHMPILTIGGEFGDNDGLQHTTRQFSSNLRHHVIPEVGHHVTEECPATLVELVADFWNDNPGFS